MSARVAVLLCAAAMFAAPGGAFAAPFVSPPPLDPEQALARGDEYAWRLFIALDRPADAGEAGADRPVAWEGWRNAVDIFRDDGADPGPWEEAAETAPAVERRFETSSLKDLPNLRHVVGGRMVPFDDPVGAARRLTEVRMNRPAYDYLRAHELYNVEGQLRAAPDGISFPAGAIEVKAQWRPIEARERARYHVLELRLADGRTSLYGLSALHIVSKVLPQWFWATFEHADNATLPDGDGWKLPSRDRYACGNERADCNRAPAGIGLEGTVWQYYRLRGTMTSFIGEDGLPARLANSGLEAGMQESSSCMTCHARASIGGAAAEPVRLPVFASVAPRAGGGFDRIGYVGFPDAAWFPRGEKAAAVRMWPLDFVWSLSLAKSKRGS